MRKRLIEYSLILFIASVIVLSTIIINETTCDNPDISCDIEFHVEKMKQITGQEYVNNWGGYFDKYPDIMHRVTLIPARLFNITIEQSFKIMRTVYLLTIIALVSVIIHQHGGKTIHKIITTLILLYVGVMGLTLAGILARTGITILLLTILITKKQSTRNLLLLIMSLTHHYGIIIAIATYVITCLTKDNKYEPHIISIVIIMGYLLGKYLTKTYILTQSYLLATIMFGLLIGLIITEQTILFNKKFYKKD